jgi:spore coat polysaccharide biosynthesis protein SpsF
MNTLIDKNDFHVVCIIQARMGSSRLPGKVLEDICADPMLGWVVYRAQQSSLISAVMVATTTDASDDAIAAWCSANAVACYRGAVQDVLDRFYQSALLAGADIIVRLTADCPLIDPQVIDDVVSLLVKNNADFVANRLPPPYHRTFPIGLDVEVVSFAALERAWHEADQPFEREHVLPYLYEEEGRFNVSILDAHQDLGALRWTVDTPQDLAFIRALMADLDCDRDVSWLTILDHIQKHPQLTRINADVKHKSYTDVDHRAGNEAEGDDE